jgi:xanthine dehydrogenase accessory factor
MTSIEFPFVSIKGAGDLASGVALRLWRAGFPVAMTEIERPLAVRRTVAFAQAVFDGECRVEEVRARHCQVADVGETLAAGLLPVLVDPQAQAVSLLRPPVVVDAIMAKRNTGTRLGAAPLVVALGPGFTVGVDCHAVVETNRGHNLGRVLWQGSAEPDTGSPGELPGVGKQASRVLRAPAAGHVIGRAAIGERVAADAIVAVVQANDGAVAEIVAPFAGVLRGLIHPSVEVWPGLKIGDLDPRADPSYCFTVSDKSLAIGGAVLEAILSWLRVAPIPRG